MSGSTPTVETYFSMFSSAVPSQLEFSISHARHDGIECVAARISASAVLIGASLCPEDDAPPVFAARTGPCP